MKKIGFIGTGYMGGALATAASKSGLDIEILLANRHKEKAEALRKQIGGTVTDNKTVAKEADYIFLGVKPQILETVYQDIKDVLEHRTDRCVIVSMIAGKELPFLKDMFGSKPIIRIMPNMPVIVGSGLSQYVFNEEVNEEEKDFFLKLMAALPAAVRPLRRCSSKLWRTVRWSAAFPEKMPTSMRRK